MRVCKEENVWSVVDAAHAIGQQQDLNLQETDPDFWVSVGHFVSVTCRYLSHVVLRMPISGFSRSVDARSYMCQKGRPLPR